MLKKFLNIILSLSCLLQLGFSTWSRIAALGVPFWMVEQDDTLLWLNPYEVSSYPNHIFAEVGTATGSGLQPVVDGNIRIGNQWGGVSFKTDFIYQGTAAVFFARPYWGMLNIAGQQAEGSDVDPVPASPSNMSMLPLPLYNKLDIFWSTNIGEYPAGLSLFFASNSSYRCSSNISQPYPNIDDVKYTENFNSSEIWAMVSTRFKQVYIFDYLDIVLNFGLHKVNNSYIDQQYDGNNFVINDNYSFVTEGIGSVELTLRGVSKFSKGISAVLLFDYYFTDLSNKFVRKTDTNLDGNFTVSAGDICYKRQQMYKINSVILSGAINISFMEKLLGIVGTNIFVNNFYINEERYQMLLERCGVDQKYQYEKLSITLPLYLACEYTVSKLLTLRCGINKVVEAIESKKVIDPDYGNWDGTKYPLKNVVETTIRRDLTSDYTTNVSLGTRLQLSEKMYIDFVLRQSVLFSGTYLISGVPETLTSQITAVYRF